MTAGSVYGTAVPVCFLSDRKTWAFLHRQTRRNKVYYLADITIGKKCVMKYEEFKDRWPVFRYHDFEVIETPWELQIRYDFEIEGLSYFNPEFSIAKPKDCGYVGMLRTVREAAFSLGMVELISYWKLTCAPTVIVECGSLNEDQIKWWKKLYFNGLGEFFYRNHIETSIDTFMDLKGVGGCADGEWDDRKFSGNLIPVGGGKDSFVTLDLLKGEYENNTAFVINHVKSAVHAAEAAGYTGDKLIVAERTLDPRMLDFNKQGFLNGHTPFSALAAFASSLAAIVYGRKYICLSNEASANESTIHDSKVNHQYSKTFEFEQDFKYYMDTYVTGQVHYFSFLRPISELMIAGIFSTLPQYHAVFRSCNVGQKEEKWCGHCAKCLFVCIMMSAYLKPQAVIDIFGRDMLNDPEMKDLFEQLTGMQDDKPFECVGTRDEVNTAVCMAIRNLGNNNEGLPDLYRLYKETSYYNAYKDRNVDWTFWNKDNLLPEAYAEILKNKLAEMNDHE